MTSTARAATATVSMGTSAAAAAAVVRSRHSTAQHGATTLQSVAAAACRYTIFARTALDIARQRTAALRAGMARAIVEGIKSKQQMLAAAGVCLRVAVAPKMADRFMAAAPVLAATHTLTGGIIGLVAAAAISAVEVVTGLLAADHLTLPACWALVAMRLLRGRHRARPENRRFSGCLA